MGGTYGGNAVSCAAAAATIDVRGGGRAGWGFKDGWFGCIGGVSTVTLA
jgi:hypothetical protein